MTIFSVISYQYVTIRCTHIWFIGYHHIIRNWTDTINRVVFCFVNRADCLHDFYKFYSMLRTYNEMIFL